MVDKVKWLVDEKSSSHKRFDKKKDFSKFLLKHQKNRKRFKFEKNR